jgi:aspartate/methionine/tyrosine aminotransferase
MQSQGNLSHTTDESDNEQNNLQNQNQLAIQVMHQEHFQIDFTCANARTAPYPKLNPKLTEAFSNKIKSFGLKSEELKVVPCGSIFEVITSMLLRVNLHAAKTSKQVVVFMPASSFGYMGAVAKDADSKLIILALNEDGTLNNTKLTEKMNRYKDSIRIFVMINPNNPSGTLWNQDEVDTIAKNLSGIDIIIEDLTFAGITEKAKYKWFNRSYNDDMLGHFTVGLFQKCQGSVIKDKVITFYSPSKEFSPEARISCLAASQLSLDNIATYGCKIGDHVASFNFPNYCQNLAIANLKDSAMALKNITYYEKRFNQVKRTIELFNAILSSKLGIENCEFIKLTQKNWQATNVATLDCSGLKTITEWQSDIDVFKAFASHVKAGLVPGSANYTNSDKMHLRIVLGENYENYYGFEKGLMNLAKVLLNNNCYHVQKEGCEDYLSSKISTQYSNTLSQQLNCSQKATTANSSIGSNHSGRLSSNDAKSQSIIPTKNESPEAQSPHILYSRLPIMPNNQKTKSTTAKVPQPSLTKKALYSL